MRALVLQKPGQASIEAVPEPVVSDADALLKAGLCGSGLNSFRGLNPLVSYPGILGPEVWATVVHCGDFAFLTARMSHCLRIAGRVAASDRVAVFGCGGVGLGAIAGSSFRGARTICIDVDDDKLDLARHAGGTDAINSARDQLHHQLLETTDGRGPDVVIEAVGAPSTFRAAVAEVAFTGRVVYIGYAKEPVAYETRLFVQKEQDILGSRNAEPQDFDAVIRMLEARRFPVDEAVSLTVTLEEAPNALRSWSENPSSFRKIMVTLD